MSYFNILFVDIETVGRTKSFDELDDRWKALWEKKAQFLQRQHPDSTLSELFSDRAAIFSEFGRVVCISVGFLHGNDSDLHFKVKSFAGKDENNLLTEFAEFINRHYFDLQRIGICGHNIREFDIPYLCRRMIKYQIKLPKAFDLYGKRPWEVKHLIDTMELWKFGDYKNYTSLDLLAAHLDVPTPKDDMDGSQVHSTFYNDDNLSRIVTYCEKDVVTTARVYLRMMHQVDFDPDNVEVVRS